MLTLPVSILACVLCMVCNFKFCFNNHTSPQNIKLDPTDQEYSKSKHIKSNGEKKDVFWALSELWLSDTRKVLYENNRDSFPTETIIVLNILLQTTAPFLVNHIMLCVSVCMETLRMRLRKLNF